VGQLQGRVAIVTGGRRGIGRAVVQRLASEGARVVIADVAAAEIPAEAEGYMAAIQVDISDPEDIQTMVRFARERFGFVNVLVNSAGVARSGTVLQLTAEDWDFVMSVNAKGYFLSCQAVIEEMRERGWGRIINIASQAGKKGEPGNAPYCASKAAVILLSDSLALELANDGITVNSVCPGLVNTEMVAEELTKRAQALSLTKEAFQQGWLERIPIGRMAEPNEIASLIAFLASEEAGYITGAAIDITGARHIS
jgi:NAD(P)-dependent dehydrogenase (short-subunit alcohol dehydrogenase family)